MKILKVNKKGVKVYRRTARGAVPAPHGAVRNILEFIGVSDRGSGPANNLAVRNVIEFIGIRPVGPCRSTIRP